MLENAPEGHAVSTPSLYRAWLGVVALMLGGDGLGVEFAARWADPWLHLVLTLSVSGLLAWRMGASAGLVTALSMALAFPLAHDFSPGAPHQLALASVISTVSLVCLLIGVHHPPRAWRWFVISALLAGLGTGSRLHVKPFCS